MKSELARASKEDTSEIPLLYLNFEWDRLGGSSHLKNIFHIPCRATEAKAWKIFKASHTAGYHQHVSASAYQKSHMDTQIHRDNSRFRRNMLDEQVSHAHGFLWGGNGSQQH